MKIRNYALIEHLDIDFHNGFSVITGETGAGKSILLGAIGLLLGQRADLRMIKSGQQRCCIEALFDLSAYDFSAFFFEHNLDFDGSECIIRRELTASGKSRAFINDTPVTLTELKEIGEQLIDIHSQHQNMFLNKEDFQLHVLDSLALNNKELASYKHLYKTYIQAQEHHRKEKEQAENALKEQEFLSFQLQQLREAKLIETEEQDLEHELCTLEHAEDIKNTLYRGIDTLENENAGIIGNLKELQKNLEAIAPVYAPAEELKNRLESCYIELKDIDAELSDKVEYVEFNPQRLTFVNERLSLIHELEQKFHVNNVVALIELEKELTQRLSDIENHESRLHELETNIQEMERQLDEIASQISMMRARAARELENGMHEKLLPLGMPNARFEVSMQSNLPFMNSGKDKVAFLFSANKNIPLQPVSQIASGGEISRLMLTLKVMISKV
ncbi:MAG: AAA family ATPase, partial [Bacteroidaceae bacterium]|nr:AAA family ATPase [Bacteroidaceae bacterium]